MNPSDLLAALTLGLAGAGHCLGMCGGIAVALRHGDQGHWSMPVSYHLGRVFSYSLLGGVLGTAASAIELAVWTVALRFIAGFLLIAMGLHTLKLWFGIRHLEAIGGRLWQYLSPLAQHYLPPKRWYQAAFIGGIWGFMPCGLIYSALAWSASAGASGMGSAALMAAFGLGTLPAMLGTSLLGNRMAGFLSNPRVRQGLGLLLVLAGCWTLWLTASHLDHLLGGHAHHATPADAMDPTDAITDPGSEHRHH